MNETKHNILIDTSPLESEHSIRGIGTYTRLLTEHLEKQPEIVIGRSGASTAEFIPDLIHYPFFDLFFSTLPLRKAKPTVVTIHDVIPLKFPKYYKPGIRGRFRFAQQKLALASVSAVITDSQASKDDIATHLKVPVSKITVVYLAADPRLGPADHQTVAKIKRKYHLPKEYVLYVGDINYNKNIPQLIKAIKFLPDTLNLVCVGKNFYPHDIAEWRWIETQLALSDVQDRVQFVTDILGNATEELAAIYSGAVAYIQPSLYEGFGLPVLEAMQCHTPVVVTNTSSLPEVGGEHVVFVEPEAESIAGGLQEVLSWSKTKRQLQIQQAFTWSKQFSWERAAKETAAVYKQVLDR